VYVSHLILSLRCKFHGNIPNDCQDIANLLLGYFNLSHPVHVDGLSEKVSFQTASESWGKSCVKRFLRNPFQSVGQ